MKLRSRHRRQAVLLALLAAPPALAPLAAQSSAPASSRAGQTLFTPADAALGVAFAGLTIAMFPLDRALAQRLTNESSRANRFFDNAATGVEIISSPGAYIIGTGLYVAGRVTRQTDLQDLGLHGTEAVVLATGITGLLKGVLGRSRPYVSADTNPRDFRLGSGFVSGTDRAAFPSGHTTVAFAAAAAVTSEMQRLWPGHSWLVAPAMYGGASLVGLSRMYHNKHWASDVALGAAIGTFSGIKVIRYAHAHPGSRLDRIFLGAAMVPSASGGQRLSWSVSVRP